MTGDFIGDAISIRHNPDGKLLAYLDGNTFNKKDLLQVINVVLNGSNNFSIEAVHVLQTHISFHNNIEIFPKLKKGGNKRK